MRTCIYQEGEIIYTEGDCFDPYYPGNPLIDWSDSVNVTTTDPNKEKMILMAVFGVIALLFIGGSR